MGGRTTAGRAARPPAPRSRAIGVAALAVLTVAILGGLATRIGPWYHALHKPGFQPPDWLFAPVWTAIFALTALAGVQAWDARPPLRRWARILALFAVNGVLNVLWSALFFTLHRPDWALAEVVPFWLSILALIIAIAPSRRGAAWLLLPYLLWVAFAAVLNLAIVRLNGPFPGA